MMFDKATEANSEGFGKFLQDHAIQSYAIPTEAHWQLGRAERHGATFMRMIDKYHLERPICDQDDFSQRLIHLRHAKNRMSRHEGYTSELWVLGKMKPVPGPNSNQYLDSASFSGLDGETTDGSRFQELMARREAARVAFVRADHCATLRRALHARSRPDRITFQTGDYVMYWKDGKGAEKGAWHGPAKVLMLEGPNVVWISHMPSLFRCAPEHVRLLSADEAQVIQSQDQQMFQMPIRSGTGVFQYRELSQQAGPPQMFPENPSVNPPNLNNPLNTPEPETLIFPNNPNPNNPDVPSQIPEPEASESTGQPDDEPTVPSTPHTEDPAISTPIPDDLDDDLFTDEHDHDHWKIEGNVLKRIHVIPHLKRFFLMMRGNVLLKPIVWIQSD